uniref:Uncharacterized protein n=1 Tax=Clastoptera arizonana TaxID=38151 RepID=A0A1B6C5L9_9HEMI
MVEGTAGKFISGKGKKIRRVLFVLGLMIGHCDLQCYTHKTQRHSTCTNGVNRRRLPTRGGYGKNELFENNSLWEKTNELLFLFKKTCFFRTNQKSIRQTVYFVRKTDKKRNEQKQHVFLSNLLFLNSLK